MQLDRTLSWVIIRTKKKSFFGGFYWPSYTNSEVKAWRKEKYEYDRRRNTGTAVIQGGESQLYLDNLASFKRRFEAEEDGRKMQIGAIVIMAAPIVGPAIGKTLATSYGRSFIRNAAINLLQNGGDYKKMDIFDIAVNTFNPFSGLGGTVGSAGLNSLVDFYPMSENSPQLNFLGEGKSIGQTGVDFSYGLFGGATGAVLGSSSTTATFMDIILGSFSTVAQESIGADK